MNPVWHLQQVDETAEEVQLLSWKWSSDATLWPVGEHPAAIEAAQTTRADKRRCLRGIKWFVKEKKWDFESEIEFTFIQYFVTITSLNDYIRQLGTRTSFMKMPSWTRT